MRSAVRGFVLQSAVCSSGSTRTIAASAAEGSVPRSSRSGLQRQAPAERSLSSSTAPKAAASAIAADAFAEEEQVEEAWGLPAHRALQILSRYRALVVDSAYRPIDVVNWQRAICMDLLGKVDILEYYEASVSSVSQQFFLPAVMRARWYGNGSSGRFGRVALNRRNILLRDKLTCQYCGKMRKEAEGLTLDHVIPQSKGGPNTWANLVTACSSCNSKKGSKTLKELRWKLRVTPREPSPYELNLVLAAIGADKAGVPSEWEGYLFSKQNEL